MEVFIEDLAEFYAGIATGGQAKLPEPALHFSDFAHWQRLWSTSGAATRQLSYWKNRLRKASPVFAAKDDVADELAARVVHEDFMYRMI